MPASACFGKQFRLDKAGEFTRVFQNGRRSTDKFFKVIAVQGNSKNPRLGMVVAKRHLSNAVNRNRVKRIIRESFRTHQDQLKGLDVVVMAREDCANQSNPELFVSLRKHWSRISRQ
jgi:ribonuclease P protein component